MLSDKVSTLYTLETQVLGILQEHAGSEESLTNPNSLTGRHLNTLPAVLHIRDSELPALITEDMYLN
jgi:hypothetical protein